MTRPRRRDPGRAGGAVPRMPTDRAQAIAAVRWMVRTIGLGFHPDTRALDYAPPLPRRLRGVYDALLDAAFQHCDVYAVGVRELQRLVRAEDRINGEGGLAMTRIETVRLRLRFCECEHTGDLDMYAADVARAGARIVSRRVSPDAEMGTLIVEVEDKRDFARRLRETPSFDFLTGAVECQAGSS
jgi:hypothetical protein